MTIKTIRHKTNPFLEDMVITIGKKNVRISPLGKEKQILVGQLTGEVSGTHVVAHKKVDSTKFVKTFADYMSFTFELSKAGNKALRVVMWSIQEDSIDKDIVILDKYAHEKFINAHSKTKPPLVLSLPTFSRGLSELEAAKIIAKSQRAGVYFINPSCMFNGDRIAFTTLLERDKGDESNEIEVQKLENNNQSE